LLITFTKHSPILTDNHFQVEELRRKKQEASITAEAFLYRSSTDSTGETTVSVAPIEQWWTFFDGVPEDEVRVASNHV
jgi:hypothetical protein